MKVSLLLCGFLGGLTGLTAQMVMPTAAQSQTAADVLCAQTGAYSVIAQRSLPGAVVQQHIFFCENNAIVDNVGFGPNGRYSYTSDHFNNGIGPNGHNINLYALPNGAVLYNSGYFQQMLGPGGMAVPASCNYGGGPNGCGAFYNRLKTAYWFVGDWIGEYACGGRHTERVSISIVNNEIVGTKTDAAGDRCVVTGQETFRAPLPDSLAPNTRWRGKQTIGTPNNPGNRQVNAQFRILENSSVQQSFKVGNATTLRRN